MRKIVDLHCHYVASQPKAVENFRNLVAQPEVVKVAVNVVHFGLEYVPEYALMTSFDCTNEELAQMIEEVASPKLVPWCWVDPLLPDPVKQAEYWVRERGMRGIKMYPPMGWYPNDERVMPVYQFAEEMNIPVLLHMGRIAPHPGLRSKWGRPIYLEEVGLATPNLKLLIGHFAPMWESEAYHMAKGFKNFFFDLTSAGFGDTQLLRRVIVEPSLGLRRLVLGTDGTGGDNLRSVQAMLEYLAGAGFSEAELAAIGCENGLAVLGE